MSKNRDYTRFSTPRVEKPVEEIQNEIVEEVVEVEQPTTREPETWAGKVVECDKLRIRVAPSTNAEILGELAKGTEVMVDLAESTEDFYKVYTSAGVEGFCMTKFLLTYLKES